MSALDVLTNCFRNVGLEVDSPSVTATDFQTVQMMRFINEAGLDISRRTSWQAMMTTEAIAASASSHTLPTDFYKLDSVYRTESTWQPVRIIVEPDEWAFLQIRTTTQPYCHIEGGELLFKPAMDTGGGVMRYVSDQWIVGKTSVTSGSDTFQFPERLIEKGAIGRWKRQAGLHYEDVLAELEADIAAEIRADRGAM